MRIKLNKANVGIPMVVRRSFTFSTRSYGMHRAEVVLTKDGDYELSIDGSYAYSTLDAAAKRSPQYKSSILDISNEMQNAVKAYDDFFVNIAKKTVRPQSRTVVERQLSLLVPQHYERTKYNLQQPRKVEVEKDLKEEANSKYFSLWGSNNSKKSQFISDNLEEEFRHRMDNWEELKRYHETIQNYFESQANKQYQTEYENRKKKLEDELYGDNKHVQSRLNEIVAKYDSKIPFDCVLDVDYYKQERMIDATASIPSILNIPDKKAVPLASGKISIKDKLKREMDADTVNTLLGLSYYLAGHLFSLSVNINLVRLSVVTGYSAYYWVQFDRKSFMTLPFSTLYPLQDFFHHPHVIDYRKSSIELIPEADFKHGIYDAIKVSDALSKNSNLIALSLNEAESICKTIVGADDLKQAIMDARANNSTIVVADKRYKNILNEIEE